MFLLQVINLLDLCRFLIDDNLLGTFTTGIRLQSHYQGFVGLNLTQLHVICRDGSALVQPYALIGKSCIQGFNHQGRIRSIIIDIHAHLVGIVYEHLRRKPLRLLRKRTHQCIHNDDMVLGIAGPQIFLMTVTIA